MEVRPNEAADVFQPPHKILPCTWDCGSATSGTCIRSPNPVLTSDATNSLERPTADSLARDRKLSQPDCRFLEGISCRTSHCGRIYPGGGDRCCDGPYCDRHIAIDISRSTSRWVSGGGRLA